MTTFHMETDSVLAMASQLKQAAETIRSESQSLSGSAGSMDWLSPSRDEYIADALAIVRTIEAQAETGMVLAGRVEREVAEWEQAAASLGGSSAFPVLPVSGGFSWNWPTLPSSPIIPVFSLVTVAPWLGELPDWLRNLYLKFFPQQAQIPMPKVFSPVPQPPSRPGYETYYEIKPQSQGGSYGGAACLPTSLSMLTAYYHNQNPNNKVATPQELVDMLDPGDGTIGKGVIFDKLNDNLNGIGYHDTRNFQSDMTGLGTELKSGPVVVNVKVGLVSVPARAIVEGNASNHSILIKGISGQNVLVNDPWSGKEMEIPLDQFEHMWSNGGHWMLVIRP